jgi:DNA invertase Pin-like site-specific DNA recombinase
MPDITTLTLGVLAAVAQHERETISARTKAALAARKARGLPLGNPRNLAAYATSAAAKGLVSAQSNAQEYARHFAEGIAEARKAGRTWQQIAARLNEQGSVTRRGKQWTASAVLVAARVAMGQRARNTTNGESHVNS